MSDRSIESDIIIVGCGAAGLAAGVNAIDISVKRGRRARVTILESAPLASRGGASRWTTSRFRIVDGELFPRWIEKMERVSGGLFDADYCRTLAAEVPSTLQFLAGNGVKLISRGMPVASREPVEVVPDGGGRAIVDALAAAFESRGGLIAYETEAVRLSLSAQGRIDGVVVRAGDGFLHTLHAESVILACGGFEGNAEMLTRYVGPNACDLKLLAPGLAANQGAGIRMAMEVGAATAGQFDMIHAELVDRRSNKPDAANYAHPFGIVVNGDGRRFFDEGQDSFEETFELIAYDVWRNQRQTAFWIGDRTVTSNPMIMLLIDTDQPPVEAPTIAELAVLLGLEPNALVHTVAEYNAGIGPQPFDPTRFDGKSTRGVSPPKSNWAYPLTTPPFTAYPLTAAVCFTYGGVRTDSTARVLSTGGVPIPGLYAAGEIVGVYYHEYPAGTSVLKALTFGRIAGAHAASQLPAMVSL